LSKISQKLKNFERVSTISAEMAEHMLIELVAVVEGIRADPEKYNEAILG